SDIQNTNNSSISDFNNSYLTSSYNYNKPNNNSLFPRKTSLNFIIGYGKRNTNNEPETSKSSKQFFISSNLSYNFKLNEKNYIYINSQNYFLKSDSYITNELFRFGGINSIRGFSENSLQANNSNLLITEYRYTPTLNLYIHTIFDYGLFQDQTITENYKKVRNLLSFGIGMGLATKSGILKIQIANGSTNKGEIKFYNSIVDICYSVKF
ncbi:MAG TPA: ShlB/FhaC/HecB family hemolysin secretion/activation protein, partial [Flavobacterium sp.]|uniref:ShlB/FhaC/HecB family hemolysin secretion/activation protein n=1 Tax=Flavobacterium sp. TaxID=239 RepID=UPI002ED4345A